MTTQQGTAQDDGGTVPVACTLTAAGLAEQGRGWERLAARAMTERAQTEHGLRLSFRLEPGAEEELRRLVAVENECCGWAEWTVQTCVGQIVLDVRSTGEGIAALHSMFTGLHRQNRFTDAEDSQPRHLHRQIAGDAGAVARALLP